jgi:hypothetical protein
LNPNEGILRGAGDLMTKDRLKWIISGLDFESLTDWEERFVESVEKHFEERVKRSGHGYLTEGEENILEKIYREKGR